jgi:glycerol-3-phosphate acyltransferase PlsY
MIGNITLIIIAYLFGSIPFGFILTKMAGLGDIRDIGSGNIGTTNVLRTGNKALAAATLVLDMFKGLMAVAMAGISGDSYIIMGAALAAVLGHLFPVWLKFKGGKGVATSFGVLLMLCFPLGATMLLIWVGMARWKKISSLAALTAFGSAPLLAWLLFGQMNLAILCVVIALLIFWTHRENIRRLINGTEGKISFGKKEEHTNEST